MDPKLSLSTALSDLYEINSYMEALYSSSLQQQMNEQVQQKQFLEANETSKKIESLKEKQLENSKAALKAKHSYHLENLDELESAELEEFHTTWDFNFKQFEEEAFQSTKDLESRQECDFDNENERLESSIPLLPKPSSQFLNMKKSQEASIRKKDFVKAHELELKMQKLQEKQLKEYTDERTDKIERLLEVLAEKQATEREKFKEKISLSRQQLKSTKALDLEALEKKHNKVRMQLVNNQNVTRSKVFHSKMPSMEINEVIRNSVNFDQPEPAGSESF